MQTQLQVFSSYSLLKSPTKINELVDEAKKRGYTSIALTDMNNLYGSIDFFKYAKKQEIKPIIGLTIETLGIINKDDLSRHVLLAKNHAGYQNLLKISSTILMSESPISFTDLQNYLSDLFVITTADHNEIYQLDESHKKDYFDKLSTLVDESSLFIGICTNGTLKNRVKEQLQISNQFNIPTAFVENIEYLNSNQAFATEVLHAIDAGDVMENPLEESQKEGQFYLRDSVVQNQVYDELNLANTKSNTQKIADNCNVEIEFNRTQLPEFSTPEGVDSVTYLKQLVVAGLKYKFKNNVPQEYQKRALYELSVIEKMGFADYFLIVWDVIKYAHENNIITGPGRGSAAGSLIAYALRITDVDPIEYDLLFERFLNPERVSMPDIDIDIPDIRRDEMVLYMQKKYGSEHMAQIITFGTLASKMAIRDVGRVFDQSQMEMSKWSNTIPNVLKIDLRTSYQESKPLQEIVKKDLLNQLLFETALQLEGLPRHFSTHAAGIVLSNDDLTNTVALRMGSNNIALTQQTKDNVEDMGLLKMDFLGLRNLTILGNAAQNVSKQVGKKLLFEKINLNDAKTLELFQAGDTDGVFQFESSGIRNVLRKIHPDSFNDVVATNALYRPGPMQNIDSFAARKNGEEPVTYPDDSLVDILKPTYGILVYQEQVMQVASKLAGFTLAEADSLRRAMAKKHKDEIDAMRGKFITGAIAKGHPEKTAIVVYDYIEKFANYGFNKSHAVAYSKIAVWLAYIKVHFSAAFYTALLNSNIHSDNKIRSYIQDAKIKKNQILPPDINESGYLFESTNKSIRFGLSCIKGIRRDFAKHILEVRKDGKFTNLVNFLQRIDSNFVKEDNIKPLILSGAFNFVSDNKRALLMDAQDLIESIQLAGNNVSLFDILAPKKNIVEDFTDTEKLNQEIEYLGTYVSGHPAERYRDATFTFINQLKENINVAILLYPKRIKKIRTKKGDQMAFVDGEDETGELSITVFPEAYRRYEGLLKEDQIIGIKGKLSRDRKNNFSFVADEIFIPTEKENDLKDALYIRVPEELDNQEQREELTKILSKFKGEQSVLVFYPKTDEKVLYNDQFGVNFSDELKAILVKKYGVKNIINKKM
ncbi:DNA polymerase III subunit alpha [Lactobacillus sp. YT155]|uniref:DNA polymerase III subunit alpha n=1 Tax=Lactobacillus sp. YT155 TaxID=3060955 RepID=UPI00265EF388|nr:DNA polymerase III subunit alpha [Lactobacillus sp. YT155]MDO1605370.1 DNA polymerase III subunit alpha [Lactobacillus sp. YT155]